LPSLSHVGESLCIGLLPAKAGSFSQVEIGDTREAYIFVLSGQA
jgi:hypothetical protein